MLSWRALGIAPAVVVCLLALQWLGVRLRQPAAHAPDVFVAKTGTVCPAVPAAAPAWTRQPGTTAVPMIGVGGHGYVGEVNGRPAFFGSWTQERWTFQLVHMSVAGWGPYGTPLYAVFRRSDLPRVGLVRAIFGMHGVRYLASRFPHLRGRRRGNK